MRDAINQNPVVQAALVGVMLLAFGFLLFTRILGSSEEAPPDSAAAPTSPAATSAADAAAAPAPGSSSEQAPAPSATGEAAAPSMSGEVVGELRPGKGMPESVVKAYEDGKVVALLVVRQRGIDDKAVKSAVEDVNRDDVAVFVTGAQGVARYSQITQGVGVNRVPALVVMRPRKLDGGMPEASVSYGFRGPQSVAQAIEDALYKGNKVPYYPE